MGTDVAEVAEKLPDPCSFKVPLFWFWLLFSWNVLVCTVLLTVFDLLHQYIQEVYVYIIVSTTYTLPLVYVLVSFFGKIVSVTLNFQFFWKKTIVFPLWCHGDPIWCEISYWKPDFTVLWWRWYTLAQNAVSLKAKIFFIKLSMDICSWIGFFFSRTWETLVSLWNLIEWSLNLSSLCVWIFSFLLAQLCFNIRWNCLILVFIHDYRCTF